MDRALAFLATRRLSTCLLAPLALGLACGSRPSSEVPVVTLKRQSFTQTVFAEGVFESVQSTLIAAPVDIQGPAKIAWLREEGSRVRKGDVVARFDPTDMETLLLEGEVGLATAEGELGQNRARTDASLLNLQQDGSLARKELRLAEQFQRKDPEIFPRIDIIESELDTELAASKLEHAEAKTKLQRELSRSEEQLLAIEKGRAVDKIERAERGLRLLEVRAPHDGILILVRDWRGEPRRVGDVVFGSEPIAELPNLDEMRVETHVLEADAGGLRKGAPAEVIVEAHADKRFLATIDHVDRMPKPKLRGLPVQYLSASLSLERTDPEVMKPGQRVRVLMKLAEIEGALVLPRQAVYERDGQQFVFRRAPDGFERARVTLGPGTAGRVVVTSGVVEGDVIALRDPERSHGEFVPSMDEDTAFQPKSVP